MAELKACQSASQSECVRANRDWQDRQYATLTTLPHLPHTCFELIQIKATFIYFQFRAAPATKTIPSAIQLKVSPKHTQIWCRNIAKKLISIGLKIAKVSLQLLLLLWPPPCGAFRGLPLSASTLIWHLLITQTLLPSLTFLGLSVAP